MCFVATEGYFWHKRVRPMGDEPISVGISSTTDQSESSDKHGEGRDLPQLPEFTLHTVHPESGRFDFPS